LIKKKASRPKTALIRRKPVLEEIKVEPERKNAGFKLASDPYVEPLRSLTPACGNYRMAKLFKDQ